MTHSIITRRAALAGAAILPAAAAGLPLMPTSARADGHAKGVDRRPWARFKLGDFEITTLLDGARKATEPQNIFGMNVPPEEFAEVSKQNFISADTFKIPFTPALVSTGAELVLFDTGLGGDNGNLPAVLQSAGYAPEDVTVVVLTHFHPDHIGGVMGSGGPTYPNARYVTGEAEYNFWTGNGADSGPGKLAAKNVKPVAEKTTFLKNGGSVTSGITAMAAFGHTPGHMVYMLESGGKQLLLAADTANHYVWSLAYPDWEVKFDADKAAAAATRKSVFGMLASDRIPFIGYHMPFPAIGFVEARDNGFRYVPQSYQLEL